MIGFSYNARPFQDGDYTLGVVDGDTLDITVDQGFHDWTIIRIRLQNIDTAEVFGVSHDSEEYERGIEHKVFVKEWLQYAQHNTEGEYDSDWPLMFVSEEYDRTGKYGRSVGRIVRKCDGADLTQSLREEFDTL